MLILRGASALSAFRLEKLTHKLAKIHPDIHLCHNLYVHFAQTSSDLPAARQNVLQQLLHYGPIELDVGSIDTSG